MFSHCFVIELVNIRWHCLPSSELFQFDLDPIVEVHERTDAQICVKVIAIRVFAFQSALAPVEAPFPLLLPLGLEAASAGDAAEGFDDLNDEYADEFTEDEL